jgi:leader peptidase (prepilin peptidase)/N-methyltransferase
VDATAGLVFLATGLAVAPAADVLATNAPIGAPLLRRVRLSRRLPLVALGTAGLGAACGLASGLTLEALSAAILCWVLVIVTRTDFEHRLIPDRIVLPGTLLLVALRTVDEPSIEWALSALLAGLVLFVIVLVYPKGLGMGDVKLAAFLGAGLGGFVAVGLFLGFFAAFVPALVLLLRHGPAARKEAIPLGPFLALGAVLALFFGPEIWDWYTSLGV